DVWGKGISQSLQCRADLVGHGLRGNTHDFRGLTIAQAVEAHEHKRLTPPLRQLTQCNLDGVAECALGELGVGACRLAVYGQNPLGDVGAIAEPAMSSVV